MGEDRRSRDARLEELAVLDALGLLDNEQKGEYRQLLGQCDESFRHDLERFHDIVAAIGVSTPPIQPPPHVRKQVLEEVRQFEPIRSQEGWTDHPIAGVRYKPLAVTSDRASVLLEMVPGVEFPRHQHVENEECYVVAGTLVEGDTTLEAGDFMLARGGSTHGPLTSPDGCTVLLGLSNEDYRVLTGESR
ncbi:MAG: cupin domain-containing protein [Thermoanaerobaculia bacterium]|nr:cupin domain-containing protein [Thermoanaerobaculia bacterium]